MTRGLLAVAVAAVASAPVVAAPATVTDLATPFVAFWDATRGLPVEARVARFKRDVAARFPAFYAPRGKLTPAAQDARIAAAIDGFGAIRSAFIAKVAGFAGALPRHIASFRAAFPAYRPTTPIYLLHSLGEMDGGTRDLDGRSVLVFGADVMVAVHGSDDEVAFFDHELFHTYHARYFPEGDAIWQALWSEGLAVHVANQLNPRASDDQLLLGQPTNLVARTRAQLPAALDDLAAALTATDPGGYAALFEGGDDGPGLPRRRGYYIGLLVAEEVGRGRGLDALARLTPDQARPLVFAAVATLRARAAR